jgi:hypothetical protein
MLSQITETELFSKLNDMEVTKVVSQHLPERTAEKKGKTTIRIPDLRSRIEPEISRIHAEILVLS